MDYTHYKNKYLNILINCDIPAWKRFEYAVALNQQMIVWSDIPPNFGEIHKLPHLMDYGIDCINLEYTKTLQAKYYNSSCPITYKKLSTYIAYSLHILGIADMNLATTPTANVSSMVVRSFPDILRFTLEELTQDLPEIPKVDKPPKVIEPRPYTVECANLFLESNQDIMRFELPCGVGKSYIIYEIIRRSSQNGLCHLILVPWIDLANQMLAELTDFGIKAALIGDNHHFDSLDNLDVLVCITASAKKLSKMDFVFGCKFVDEAHHIEKLESVQLGYINQIECEKELHLSATFRKIHPLDYQMTLRNAIDDGWLSDYRLYIEYFTAGDMFQNIVELVKTNMDWFPMFVYFNTTERAIKFAELVGCEYLIGTCTRSKRSRIVDDLNNYRCPVLALCGCFNEGISINNLTTVVFGDYRFSKINRIQIAMRASRLHPNKPFSRLVFPICEGSVEDKDLHNMLTSFGEIDPMLSKSMKNGGTRVSINTRNEKAETVEAEFIREQIYNSFGKLISKLTVEEKIDEFVRWIKLFNFIPMQKSEYIFSDTTKMGIFWSHCKGGLKCDKLPYSQLLDIVILKQDYYTIIDIKNKNAGQKKITLYDKIDEFIKWVNLNKCVPMAKCEDLFSDGAKVGLFWVKCKSHKKLDRPEYSKLLNINILKKDYDGTLKIMEKNNKNNNLTISGKVDEFIKWIELNRCTPTIRCKSLFSDKTKIGAFWIKCKYELKCNKHPYIKLLKNQITKESYVEYIKNNKLEEWSKYDRVCKFIGLVNIYGLPKKDFIIGNHNITPYEYWLDIKTNKKCQDWPYIELLDVQILKDDYQ